MNCTALYRATYHLLRAGLFRFDPEYIHERTISLLSYLPATTRAKTKDPVTIAGISFPNRVGLAAGLDKDGKAASAWAHFGFGFAELGTVTAKAQPGNDRPRIFRAPSSKAIVNRMGFNNQGADALAKRLARLGVRRGQRTLGIPLGISIGKSKVTPMEIATEDYLESLDAVAPYADYIAINVSSPNTPGLRNLQSALELQHLLDALVSRVKANSGPPIFVKLAPDFSSAELSNTLGVLASSQVAGVIATNTTLSREGLAASERRLEAEAGGLSGAPLTTKSLAFVEKIKDRIDLPIIGVGGIMSPMDARRMFDAGADLIQLYTGFIYEGPALVRGILEVSR